LSRNIVSMARVKPINATPYPAAATSVPGVAELYWPSVAACHRGHVLPLSGFERLRFVLGQYSSLGAKHLCAAYDMCRAAGMGHNQQL
jgi:hypothetical protein